MPRPKQIGRTMRAAHQLKLASQGEMAMAVELIDVHTPKNQELSLIARRCLLLMLEAAAGDAWKNAAHRIAKKDLRGSHKSMDRVRPAFEELMGVWFSHADTLGSKKSTRMFHLLESVNDQDDESSSAFVEFTFSERARVMLERSEVYARLSREAIIKFQSRYSLRMYEIGAALYSKRDPTWVGEVAELRRLLHVPKDTYPNFADFRKRILEPARAEINQLAEFTFDWKEHTSGRQVVRIGLNFTAKPGRLALAAAEENSRHGAGRKARREAAVETIVQPGGGYIGPAPAQLGTSATFDVRRDDQGVVRVGGTPLKSAPKSELVWPADDDVTDYFTGTAELYRIAADHGGGHSVARLAAAYVSAMGEKRFALSGDRLRSSWRGHCEAKAKAWQVVS